MAARVETEPAVLRVEGEPAVLRAKLITSGDAGLPPLSSFLAHPANKAKAATVIKIIFFISLKF
jgi:hypothetical protein